MCQPLEIRFKSTSSEARVRQTHQQSTAIFDTVVVVLESESKLRIAISSGNGTVEHGVYISARVRQQRNPARPLKPGHINCQLAGMSTVPLSASWYENCERSGRMKSRGAREGKMLEREIATSFVSQNGSQCCVAQSDDYPTYRAMRRDS